jgi:hypothetical protein
MRRTFWPDLRGFREHGLESDTSPGRDDESESDHGLSHEVGST